VRDVVVEALSAAPDVVSITTVADDGALVRECAGWQLDAVILQVDDEARALALARALQRCDPDLDLVAVGTGRAVLGASLQAAGFHAVVQDGAGSRAVIEALGSARRRPRPRRAPSSRTRSIASPREVDVLELLADGCAAAEVSARLGISVKTVESLKDRVFHKLGVRNSAHAVRVAIDWGLLPRGTGAP
jgi:DNA-binding NarL/FixJ family response regulator